MATCNFLLNPIFAFVRLNCPILLDDFSEINKPSRFLILILGPSGSGVNVLDLGRAFGSLFTDQLFCQLTAYKANSRLSLLRGLKTYLSEMTVLPPSSWEPSAVRTRSARSAGAQPRLFAQQRSDRVSIRRCHPARTHQTGTNAPLAHTTSVQATPL